MYCKNCGNKGHSYKECNEPNISCGVILYHKKKNDYELLMIERKDSFCYIDFIRGKYLMNDLDHINLLLSRISIKEINKLRSKSFIELWYDLWKKSKPDNINESKLSNEYMASKIKYNKLKNGYQLKGNFIKLDNLLDNIKSIYTGPEWEFPKGRRILNESNKSCAIRELKEETNIKSDDFKLFKNIIPFSEIIHGENNIKYKNIYYLGICNNINNIKIDNNNKNQIYEINDLNFFKEEEALLKIRPYNNSKKNIITNIFNFLNNKLNNYIIK